MRFCFGQAIQTQEVEMMRKVEAMKKFTRSVNFPNQKKYKPALAGCQKAKK